MFQKYIFLLSPLFPSPITLGELWVLIEWVGLGGAKLNEATQPALSRIQECKGEDTKETALPIGLIFLSLSAAGQKHWEDHQPLFLIKVLFILPFQNRWYLFLAHRWVKQCRDGSFTQQFSFLTELSLSTVVISRSAAPPPPTHPFLPHAWFSSDVFKEILKWALQYQTDIALVCNTGTTEMSRLHWFKASQWCH